MPPEDAGVADLLATDLDRYFGQLVLTYEARLFAFMARQTGSTQEAEDIVQEAFMQAYFALGRYSQQQRAAIALRPWLYKIALNIFYSGTRAGKPGAPGAGGITVDRFKRPRSECARGGERGTRAVPSSVVGRSFSPN